jgi:uncharacterized protein (TIGR02646 family)
MHKLDRASIAAPICLSEYHAPTHTWDKDVTGAHKQEIRTCLKQMQGDRCAYCEGAVYSHAHIEHFRRKNPRHFPQLMFDWSNLFLSCESHEHCGHYKDRPGADSYNATILVKPDEHEPDDYFYFHSGGDVRPRSGLDPMQLTRALETIRVFNLDCGVLRAERRRALKQYLRKDPGMLEVLMEFDEHSRQEFINEEIEATKNDYHCTVIRHYFEKI